MIKICSKCNIEKQVDNFSKKSSSKDGLSSRCKSCCSIYDAKYRSENLKKKANSDAAYYAKNSEKIKAYYIKWKSDNSIKVKEYASKFYANNSKKINEYSARWYANNPEKAADCRAKYRANNKEKVRILGAKWRADNLETCRIYSHNRRALNRAAIGKLSKGLSDRLFKLQKGRCACCKKLLADNFHMDHITALSKGGSNHDWNIQLLCQPCNNSKSAKDPIDFMQSRGFLL